MANFQEFSSTVFDLDSLSYLTTFGLPEISEISPNIVIGQNSRVPQTFHSNQICDLSQEFGQTQGFDVPPSYAIPSNMAQNSTSTQISTLGQSQSTARSYQTSYGWNSSQGCSSESSQNQSPTTEELFNFNLDDFIDLDLNFNINYNVPEMTTLAAPVKSNPLKRNAAHMEESNELEQNNRAKRIRTAFTSDQLYELETSFRRCSYLSKERRAELMTQLRLTSRQLKIWFQNRRMKEKRTKNAQIRNSLEQVMSLDEPVTPEKKAIRPRSLSQHSDDEIRDTLLAYKNFDCIRSR